MKLKYYLRGVGIGIIFATLVMTVSSFVHKNNISDDYIIKEARKLGMVMKDELDDDEGLWGSNDTEVDSVVESEDTEDIQKSESTQVAGSEAENSESESTSESESEPQIPVVPEPPVESETPVEPQQPADSQTPTHVTIVIERGDYARQVAEKLFAAGLVTDVEEFRVFMGNHGYAHSIHAGTYSIPVDATYEDICKIVAG